MLCIWGPPPLNSITLRECFCFISILICCTVKSPGLGFSEFFILSGNVLPPPHPPPPLISWVQVKAWWSTHADPKGLWDIGLKQKANSLDPPAVLLHSHTHMECISASTLTTLQEGIPLCVCVEKVCLLMNCSVMLSFYWHIKK